MKNENYDEKQRIAYEKVALKQERRRKKRRKKAVMVLSVVLILSAVVASMTVFFNIENIEVTGATVNTAEEIILKSEIQVGDNLFRIQTEEVKAKMKLSFAYVEDVKFKRKFPNTLELQITEAKETGAVGSNGSYTILSEENRVLKTGVQEIPANISLIKGVDVAESMIGSYILVGDERQSELLKKLYDTLALHELGNITVLDIENTENINLEIGHKQQVILGDSNDLDYKIDMLSEITKNHLNPNEEIVIDCRDPKRVVTSPKKN